MTTDNNGAVARSSEPSVNSLQTLDAVVLYDTIATGKRGLSILAYMTGILEDDLVELRPWPWRLDLLQDPTAAEYAMHDTSTAHVIVLSTSGNVPLRLAFKTWFATILAQRQSMEEHVAVVALLGLDETTTQAASRDFHFVKQLTLEAELDFFAPCFSDRPSMKMDFIKESLVKEPPNEDVALILG
jgi:hypothetical protein